MEYVQSQHFTSTADIMTAMKEMFRNVIQRDIAEQIKSLYDVDISPKLVSKIREKIMPEVTAWQNRPPGGCVSFRIHGCYPQQGQGRSPLCDQGSLCGAGHHYGGGLRHLGRMDLGA